MVHPHPHMWALPELVEAASRAGDVELAYDALARLEETTQPCGTDIALGIGARCHALLSDGTPADDLYREAISRLSRTRLRPDLARAHLLYGEWLRREGRRLDAREQLRTAHGMLLAIGMEAFAERARRELIATGEKVRKRTVDTLTVLTAQEAYVARLARDGRTNQEIGAQLYLSARTVEWHLRNVFTKARHQLAPRTAHRTRAARAGQSAGLAAGLAGPARGGRMPQHGPGMRARVFSLGRRSVNILSVVPDTTPQGGRNEHEPKHSSHPSTAVEQAPGLWRTSLQQYDLSVPGREMIQVRVDIEPDSPPIRHFHYGEEIIYVLEGPLEYRIDGQPTKVYNTGDALTVPAEVIHAVRNVGTGNATELATYVVEKGKPLLNLAD